MAEFKLGRIKFVWKGEWTTGSTYYVDDVVRFGGNTFICVAGHTADVDFYTDLDYVPARWNLVSGGQDWKGDWTVDTDYVVGDIVKYGGILYVCNTPHASAATEALGLENDQSVALTNVVINNTAGQFSCDAAVLSINATVTIAGSAFSSGSIVGYTDPKTYYVIETNGTTTFTLSATRGGPAVVTTASTGAVTGVTFKTSKWDFFSEGFAWTGDWATSTRYKKNDIVKYGGIVYVCNLHHTSAPDINSGLENNQSNWDTFNAGIEFKGDWTTSTKYKVNDVVKSGAGLWICIINHVASNFTTDIAKWEQYVEGLEFESTYSSLTTYQPGDVVRYGGNQYVAKTINLSQNPVTQSTTWDLLSEGFSYRNDWAFGTSYKIGEVVRLNGNTYVATIDTVSSSITVTISNTATKRFTTSGSTGSLFAGQAIAFTGTTFGNVLTGAIYYVHTVYNATQFSISTTAGGPEFTPFNSSGSMTATSTVMPPNASFWELLTSGMYWRAEWTDDVQYYVNDVVRYGSNSYICILTHRSEGDDGSTVASQGGGADNSRPDQDITGTYWNILTVGDETSVLTTRGDLVYFGGAGPARLPVGVEGQVLRVSANNEPEWATLGHVDHVYFVGTSGTDAPAPVHGMNFDKPWKTIRYACEQVEKGPRFPNAQRLLEMNRVFIQREVTEWIDWQINRNTIDVPNSASVWYNYDYDEYKCERDTGFIVDRLIWDIGHGGNLKMLSAALAYINALDGGGGTFSTALDENGTGIYSLVNDEAEADVLAFNYMLTLVEKVLNNQAPAVNYQVTNGDNSTSIVTQFFDTSLTLESGVLAEITHLVGIITTALTDGNDLNLPTRLVPNSLIQVATGRYREILPIIVPAETCVIGDEVRSTNAGPEIGTTPIEDSPYTITAYGRLEEIIGDIVTGSVVTPTTGNSSPQSIEVPFATDNERASSEKLARILQNNIDFRLGTITTFEYPEPTGYDVSYLIGYKNSRDLLLANKAFFQQQIKAYIDTNYPELFYSRTACMRDVGYIVDALVYDLTYGGYSQTLNAALAYYQGYGSTLYIDSTEKQATLAAYVYLKDAMALAANNSIVPSNQTVETQVFGTAGSAASITLINNNMDIIYDVINGGLTAAPSVTVTTIATNLCTTSGAHSLQVGDTFTPRTTVNGFVSGTKYYIITTPAPNTFTVSVSFGGTAANLTDGTGLTIVGDIVDNPEVTWAPAPMKLAFTGLTVETSNIKVNTIDFINSNYGDFVYDSAKCRRDTGYIVDGAYYDAALGTNYNGVVNGIAYRRASANLVLENQLAQTIGALEHAKTLIENSLVSNTTAQTRASDALEEAYTIIEFGIGTVPAITWTDPGVDANKRYAREQLQTNRAFIISDVSTWISTTYPSLWATIDQAMWQRNIGYTVDAFSYDVQYGGNTATRRSAQSYFDDGVSILPSGEKAAFAATITRIGSVCSQVVRETYAGQDTSGTAASATEATQMTTFAGNIQSVITADSLSGLVAESLPSISWASAGIQTAVEQLAIDKTGIVADTLQYITTNYSSFNYNHSKCSRDIGIIIDAVGYDMMFGGNFQTMKAAYSYLRETATEVFELNQKNVTRDALVYVREQAVAIIGGIPAAVTKLTELMQTIDDVLFMATDEGDVCQSELRTVDYAVLQLERNRDFIVSELTAWISDTYPSYTYDVAMCERDVNRVIDAIKWDLRYSGNYKTRFCARYYANSVKGSLEEDMFYLRNGTGLRNMTLQGLTGDLTPENEFGTRRVTAGAYASLDPGWGPDDFRTWIIARSPYVQNLTTFGYAAIGQKIDGALHNGGNDSIVSNDFTQIISDGIGAWVTNNGRAELVSVFTYYAHIGYLAEAGGRIRGTNGNNSYGDFGSVAEGFDVTETPNTAIVDNKFQSKAIVGEIYTNGDEIIAFQFDSAGNDHTEASWIISGPGTGTDIVQDEFRDGGVFNIFLQDFVDDSATAPEASGNFGGIGYVSNSNTAQAGTLTSLTVAATDPEISSAYIGMKIYLTGGTGAGQYGIITAYNSGTKLAAVKKESDDTAGWDHLLAGTTIVSPDASTTYTIEPRISFSAPTYSSATMTLPSSGTWTSLVYGDTTAVYTLLSGTYVGEGSGATWQVIRNGWKYIVNHIGAGTGYSRFDTITIKGSDLGGEDITNDIIITVTSANATTGAIQAFETEGYGVGGRYVALRSGSQAGATSSNGTSWTGNATLMPSAANWSSIAHGILDDGSSIGKFSKYVAVATGGTSAAYSNDGLTWVAATLPFSRNWTGVAFGADRFVAVASNLTRTAVSLDGEVWDIPGTTISTGYVDITYGKKLFVAITSTGTISTSADGIVWADTASLGSGTWTSITYGNNKFVAVKSDSNSGAYSIDGTTWVAMTIGSADGSTVGGCQQVAYGQGVFVATVYQAGSQDYSFIMSSEDGLYWTSKGVEAPANSISGYGAIAFGTAQRTGRWVVLSKDSGTHAATIRNGCRARARSFVAEEKIFSIRVIEPGSGYDTAPTLTITDPNNIYEAPALVRIGNGVLAFPTFVDRGTGYISGSAEIDIADGYGNFLQDGQFVAVRRLSQKPVAGSNVVFGHLPDQTFKLVNVFTFLGQFDGSYTAFFQVSPPMKTFNVAPQGTSVTTRIRYSQVRLTGHDFLDIGTGNFDETNYPGGIPEQPPTQANETVENNGGRVFYTSTDQDGNFRVGGLFTIEQSTGIATLNADAFNIAGLQELSLGEVTLGGGSASITEFSTDPFFTQDSDNVVSTQRAIKAYISAQIGGGGASLNVNSVTAGFIYIAGSQITTTTGGTISVKAKMNFKRSISGMPVAWHYFLK